MDSLLVRYALATIVAVAGLATLFFAYLAGCSAAAYREQHQFNVGMATAAALAIAGGAAVLLGCQVARRSRRQP